MLNYKTITSPDINNGLGCRMTIWISGCTHRCPGCHNPELWDYNNGSTLFTEKVINFITKELTLNLIKIELNTIHLYLFDNYYTYY